MIKYIFIILLLASCSKPTDFSTPAQSHIDEYRLQARQCKAAAKGELNKPAAPPQLKPDINTLFAINSNDIALGNPESSVIVVEYASPTCAHCAFFHKSVFPELKKNYIDTGKIAYILRLFISNKQDLDAGILTLCAGKTVFHKVVGVLLDQQSAWAFNSNYRDILTNIGQLSGVEPEQYAKCLADEKLSGLLIDQSRALGRVPGFVGTPSFIINGVFFNGVYTYESLAKAIDQAIKK